MGNNGCASLPGTTFYKDKVIEATQFVHDFETGELFKAELTEDDFRREVGRQIPIENSHGPVLAIKGLADKAGTMVNVMKERAEAHGKFDVQILKYPGLGHLLDPPNFPVCLEGTNPLLPKDKIVNYGGDIQLHSLAQIDVWDKVVVSSTRLR